MLPLRQYGHWPSDAGEIPAVQVHREPPPQEVLSQILGTDPRRVSLRRRFQRASVR
jgi:hypothetical protein